MSERENTHGLPACQYGSLSLVATHHPSDLRAENQRWVMKSDQGSMIDYPEASEAQAPLSSAAI